MNQPFLPGSNAVAPPPPSFAQIYAAADEQRRCEMDERAAIYEYDGKFSREEAETRTARDFQVLKPPERIIG